MNKRIVICADGTWNRPEKNIKKDFPTNVLRLARAIKPVGKDKMPQQVFYDWGIGSYYDKVKGGATGQGIEQQLHGDFRGPLGAIPRLGEAHQARGSTRQHVAALQRQPHQAQAQGIGAGLAGPQDAELRQPAGVDRQRGTDPEGGIHR